MKITKVTITQNLVSVQSDKYLDLLRAKHFTNPLKSERIEDEIKSVNTLIINKTIKCREITSEHLNHNKMNRTEYQEVYENYIEEIKMLIEHLDMLNILLGPEPAQAG